MIYTKNQLVRMMSRSVGRENVTSTKNAVKVKCAQSNAAEFGVVGLGTLHNVHAYTERAYIVIPLNSSGHTIRACGH